MLRKTSENKSKIRSEKDFKRIYEEYYRSLYFYAKSFLKDDFNADDIVQETFFYLWKRKDELEIQTISGLLYTDVRNRCINLLNHRKVKEKHLQYEKAKDEDTLDSMLPFYEEELMRMIIKLVKHLPQKQKNALQYKIIGYSISEIAQKMLVSENTVKTHLLKARKFLRSHLSNTIYFWAFIKIFKNF